MNFIYFVCHDLGRHLGCYGRKVKSPFLDAFANEGLRFDIAFCNTAVCSPSRAACMTGLHAHQNGMMGLFHFGWRIKPGVKTIVDYFNEAGFETVHTGFSHEGEELHSRYQVDFERHWRSHGIETAVDDAIAWLEGRQKQKRTQPFYLNIGTVEVHPSVYRKDEDKEGYPSRFWRDYGGPVDETETEVPPPTPDIPLLREDFSRFESAIRYMDKHFGRLVNNIKTLGLDEDTMVIFTTDHGMNDWHGKGWLYERGTEIALLVQAPRKFRKPTVRKDIIQNIDIVPTLLEAAGLPIPKELEGRSFWPLVKGEPYKNHDEIILEWNFGGPQDDYSPVRSLRGEKYKLLWNFGPHHFDYWRLDEIDPNFTKEQWLYKRYKNYGPPFQHPERMLEEFELYDLENDPNELMNLADKPAYKTVLQDMKKRLEAWMKEKNDVVLKEDTPRIPSKAGWHFKTE